MAWYDLLGAGDLEASIGIAIFLVMLAVCYLLVDTTRAFRYRLDWLLDSIYEDLLWFNDSETEFVDGTVLSIAPDTDMAWILPYPGEFTWKAAGRALGWSLKDIELMSTRAPQSTHFSFGRSINSGTSTVCQDVLAVQPLRNLLRLIPRSTRKRIIAELKFYWDECEGKCCSYEIVVKRNDGIHWIRILLEMRQQDIAARLKNVPGADCSLPLCGFLLTADHVHVECGGALLEKTHLRLVE